VRRDFGRQYQVLKHAGSGRLALVSIQTRDSLHMLSGFDLAILMKLRQVVAWTLPTLATLLAVMLFVSMAWR
jgi:hypothetical protein